MTAPRRQRAKPLHPDDRRAALARAVVPLLARHGRAVTTRQIAEAAGVAEGTIFRVFRDKDSLIDAAVEQALDVSDLEAHLRRVDPDQPLEARVAAAVTLVRRRMELFYQVLFAARPAGPPRFPKPDHRPHLGANARIDELIAALLEPDAARLRTQPAEAARWLRITTMAATHPLMNNGQPLSDERIAALVLGGIEC